MYACCAFRRARLPSSARRGAVAFVSGASGAGLVTPQPRPQRAFLQFGGAYAMDGRWRLLLRQHRALFCYYAFSRRVGWASADSLPACASRPFPCVAL